jgi:hypothetical protein|tara:strand:+ start:6249 stop:6473 length:225 start_codon:yes stop_codon:yes gene_type:complete
MSGLKKTIIKPRLKIPEGMADRLTKMAEEREMTLDDLLSELVVVAVVSLKQNNSPRPTGWERNGDWEHLLPPHE